MKVWRSVAGGSALRDLGADLFSGFRRSLFILDRASFARESTTPEQQADPPVGDSSDAGRAVSDSIEFVIGDRSDLDVVALSAGLRLSRPPRCRSRSRLITGGLIGDARGCRPRWLPEARARAPVW
jgi:hypothetical protein